jgi:hypothetical protein
VRPPVVAGTRTGRPRVTGTVTSRPTIVRRTRRRCNTCFWTASTIPNRSLSRLVAPRASARSFVVAFGSVCTRTLPDTSTGRDMTMRRLARFVRRTCTVSSARCRRCRERDVGCNTAETMRTRTSLAGFWRARFLPAAGVVVGGVIGREARGGPSVGIDELSLRPESLATAAPIASPLIPATTTIATSLASPGSALLNVRPYGGRGRPPGSRVRKRGRTSASA